MTDTQKPAVLIVDDEPAVCSFVQRALELAGYAAHYAHSCAEGRRLFSKGAFACAIIDLGLPDGDGMDLLGEFTEVDPSLVVIVLTGDASAERIIDTMRAGAFDYLTKPVDVTTLRAAIARAVAHHDVVRERAELVQLLLEEREQLRARIEAATADIRQYASACEVSNTRLRALVELARLSAHFSTEEQLMRSVFETLRKHVPLHCIALCDVSRKMLLAVHDNEFGECEYVQAESETTQAGYDTFLIEADPRQVVRNWVERSLDFDTGERIPLVFLQTFWGRNIGAVGFYLDQDFTPEEADEEFLGMCAHFLAFEWEQARLLLHVAHHASLGNIALELARNFIQPLTAIRTAADIVRELSDSPECVEGMEVINENVERLRRQTQEFRRLSLMREDCVETVDLAQYIEQALDMLSVAIRNRNVRITKDFAGDFECVLLNGTALARTFLDLILGALRAVDIGGEVRIALRATGADHVAFELSYGGRRPEIFSAGPQGLPGADYAIARHPGLQLAERTVRTCGGALTVERDEAGHSMLRIVLPRNATDPSAARQVTW